MKERFDLDNFPTSESAKRQLSYVAEEFYERSYVGKWIYQVMGLEYDKARKLVEDLPNQMFIETATWGLMYHEIKWQLPVRTNLSYEERRKLIYQKRDYRAPMTPYRMEKHLRDITDFEVHVSDIHDRGEFYVENFIFNGAWILDGSVILDHKVSSFPHPNIFRVVFIGEGTLNVKRVKKILDRIKQSHTMYILCEWVIISLDSQELEKVKLHSMEFQMGFHFFVCKTFDGSWFLDGSVILGQSVICDMNINIITGPVFLINAEYLDIGAGIKFCLEDLQARNALSRIDLRAELNTDNFCRDMALDTTFEVIENSEFGENFVIIKKDLWYLDGTELLDGSRLLDAEIRKESL
ncbi:putative phage tail protein [Candidatus Merdisoma sp. JLR.KK006]|uniref:putative phage tail protein n=1 Tax=Candidatus Merdisoma sp. JLR.KK006 TaxID=3112626 RepID=UPI002FF43A96